MGSWEWLVDADELIWSDNHFRLYGMTPGQVEPTMAFVIENTHRDDQGLMRSEIERVRAGAGAQLFEYRIVRRDGEVRDLRSTIAEVEVNPRRVIGYVQDITERRRAERTSDAHIAVAEALGRWESLERSGPKLLRALGEGMGFVAGAVWVPHAEFLVVRAFWHTNAAETSGLETFATAHRVPRGLGLPGRAWISREPTILANAFDDSAFGERGPATLAGLRGAMALPAVKEEQVLAVLEFYSRDRSPPGDRLMRSLTGIGHELGHFLDRRRHDLDPVALTSRQLEVLQLASRGHSAAQIATEMMVSHETVKTHLKHIYLRLDVNDRAAAVAQALRMGLIE
jgi:PAS domain S-box-containing protein